MEKAFKANWVDRNDFSIRIKPLRKFVELFISFDPKWRISSCLFIAIKIPTVCTVTAYQIDTFWICIKRKLDCLECNRIKSHQWIVFNIYGNIFAGRCLEKAPTIIDI